MPKIIHYREECIGCNSCVEYASAYWKMQEDGKALLLGAKKKGDMYVKEIADFEVAENEMAAMACPMKSIHIIDDKGKEIA